MLIFYCTLFRWGDFKWVSFSLLYVLDFSSFFQIAALPSWVQGRGLRVSELILPKHGFKNYYHHTMLLGTFSARDSGFMRKLLWYLLWLVNTESMVVFIFLEIYGNIKMYKWLPNLLSILFVLFQWSEQVQCTVDNNLEKLNISYNKLHSCIQLYMKNRMHKMHTEM